MKCVARIVGVEFLLLKIRGQSFMLHQIRNMVGLAVDIVRGAAVDVTLPLALSDHIVHTPMAPATGLFLYSVRQNTACMSFTDVTCRIHYATLQMLWAATRSRVPLLIVSRPLPA